MLACAVIGCIPSSLKFIIGVSHFGRINHFWPTDLFVTNPVLVSSKTLSTPKISMLDVICIELTLILKPSYGEGMVLSSLGDSDSLITPAFVPSRCCTGISIGMPGFGSLAVNAVDPLRRIFGPASNRQQTVSVSAKILSKS